MTLSTDDVRRFRREGWLAVPDFFDRREATALRGAFEELRDGGVFVNVATLGDGATRSAAKQNLQICPLSYHSRLFAALPFHPKVQQAVTALLGAPCHKFLDQIFYKPARNGAGTNWHQDNYYFHKADPFAGTAMWVALHDATVANGTLRVIPRAFDRVLEHGRDPESDHHSRCWPDEAGAVPVELPAGGVVFFCINTPHATGGNTTERERAGLAYHFLRLDSPMQDDLEVVQQGNKLYGEPGQAHGPILSGPDYSGGRREYGRDMEAELRQEIDRLAGVPARPVPAPQPAAP